MLDVERLAALDARKFDGAEHAAPLFVVPDDAGLPAQPRVDREVDHALDEAQIVASGRGGAREIAALLHQRLLGADELGELLGEPVADVDLVELHVAERVLFDVFAARKHLRHDLLDRRAFAHEDADAILFVHLLLETLGLGRDVELHLRHVNGVDVEVRSREVEVFDESERRKPLAVHLGGVSGEPAAVAAHHLVHEEHARVGALLVDDVLEEDRALLGGRPGAERLADGIDVVVDRLRQPHHGERRSRSS